MSKEELLDRLLVRQGMLDAWKLKTAQFTDPDWEVYSEASGILADAPIYIDDTPALSVTEIRTKARRMKRQHNCFPILIVPFLEFPIHLPQY